MRSSIVALLLLAGCAQSDAVRITNEVARLDKTLRSTAMPASLQDLVKREQKLIAEIPKDGAVDQRLLKLREPFVAIEAFSFVATHPNEAKNLAAFEKLWQERRAAFDQVTAVHGSVVRRGLYQRAVNKGQVLVKASLPYGRTSAPEDGLYYLGEAEGNRRFGVFLASLRGGRDEEAPSGAAVNGALLAAEEENLAAFEKQANRDQILQSAKLKEARELMDRGWMEGASLLLDKKTAPPQPILPARAAVTVTLVRWPYT